MIRAENKTLKNLLQGLNSKLPQLMSSGVGTLSFLICNFYPLNRYFCSGSVTQQQHTERTH